VVQISGRLKRPWPQLSALTVPISAVGALALAGLGYFLPDLLGVLSGAFAASLLLVFAIVGFAVLHAVTRGTAGRGLVLGSAYAAALFVGWPVVAVALLGLAETLFNIRLRVAHRHRPPTLPTQ
jgi:hypothetical protein